MEEEIPGRQLGRCAGLVAGPMSSALHIHLYPGLDTEGWRVDLSHPQRVDDRRFPPH